MAGQRVRFSHLALQDINILMNNTGIYLPPSSTECQMAIELVLAMPQKTISNRGANGHRVKHNLLFKFKNYNNLNFKITTT
jgi:hypothetical protein